MKRRELGSPVDPRDRLAHRPVVEGWAVFATLRSVGATMWRNPDPARAASRTGSVALLTRTRSK